MNKNSHGKCPKGSKGGLKDDVLFPSLFSDCDCFGIDPAAGNVNRTSGAFNNVGSNGNYWSQTGNSATNGRNLNFNSSTLNRSNTNNRANAFPVRPVQEFISAQGPAPYSVTKEQLLVDLYRAYKDARRGKRRKPYQLRFEMNLETELLKLRDEIWTHRYRPSKSMCFIITEPKQREVFAAHFRDRIVHHLFFNYTSDLFESLFIADSYSCRIGKGTHYGMARLDHHIRSVSDNYTRPCYVMKMDIEGYFMHIDRTILLRLVLEDMERVRKHRSVFKGHTWEQAVDYPLVSFLAERIIMYNPLENCYIKGKRSDWDGLPPSKSLFHTPTGCGLPIGNLTSQLFSNVYLDRLDQFMKRELKCSHYGRYVDDFYIVSDNKNFLHGLVPSVDAFLRRELGLKLHPLKTVIFNSACGVPFLGAYILPYRWYIDNACLERMRCKMSDLNAIDNPQRLMSSLNSDIGIMRHFSTCNIRRVLLPQVNTAFKFGCFLKFFNLYQLNRCCRPAASLPIDCLLYDDVS